jgi:hypothetical protein
MAAARPDIVGYRVDVSSAFRCYVRFVPTLDEVKSILRDEPSLEPVIVTPLLAPLDLTQLMETAQ